jgi:hypothetical protein
MTEISLRSVTLRLTGRDIRKTFSTDFATRLAFQKSMYLLQEAGLTAEKHSFNYYAHGPYSPDWARVGFAVASGKRASIHLTGHITGVKRLIDLNRHDTSWLVALATVHWYAKKVGLDKAHALRQATEDGKAGVVKWFDTAWQTLDSAHWLAH